jgi:hypothetical protein
MKGKLRRSVALEVFIVPEDVLQLNRRNIYVVNNVKYLGVIFGRRMTWRRHIRTAVKSLGIYIRTYFPIQK